MKDSPNALHIDIISDVVCPWCYIGKRRIEAALTLYAERHPGQPAPRLAWHPFQLNPELPREGMPRQEYMANKFGAERVAEMHARLTEVGASVGIAFAFDKITRQPNTLAAHSLIQWAGQRGDQAAMKEALMRAYFVDGEDLTDDATLVRLAAVAGIAQAEAEVCLATEEVRKLVAAEEASARKIGVEGVPFFIFNRRLGVSGAQEPEALLAAMEEALAEVAE